MNSSDRIAIFDVDGTLVDSTYHHAMAWGAAFASCQLPVPMWRIHRSIGMGGDRLVSALCGDDIETRLGDTLRERWSEAYQRKVADVVALPGARQIVEALRQRGFAICVATSGSEGDTEKALRIAEVTDLVDKVVTGDDVDRSKPSPDVIERGWQRAGGGPALVFGDSVYDVEAARRLNLACVAVRTGGFGAAELEDAGAVLVVDELSNLRADEVTRLL